MVEEKVMTVNLRREILREPRWKRNKECVRVLRKILEKHVKSDVKFDKKLNERLWSGKLKKLRVKLRKLSDNSFKAELME